MNSSAMMAVTGSLCCRHLADLKNADGGSFLLVNIKNENGSWLHLEWEMLSGQDAGPVPMWLHHVHPTHVSPPGGSKRPPYSTHSPKTHLVLHPQSLYFRTLLAFPVLECVCLRCDDYIQLIWSVWTLLNMKTHLKINLFEGPVWTCVLINPRSLGLNIVTGTCLNISADMMA